MGRESQPLIPVYVHGENNSTAQFAGGKGRVFIGSMAEGGYAGERSILLTIEAKDEDTGKTIDIEIAVPVSQVELLTLEMTKAATHQG